MLSIGRIFAGGGWEYLWEQVAQGKEDYYLSGVARGEAPGRWGGRAAVPELGLSGTVRAQQMEALFDRFQDPRQGQWLGGPPKVYRSVQDRVASGLADHEMATARRWLRRERALRTEEAPVERIDTERRAWYGRADERWAERERTIRRCGERRAVAGLDLTFSPPKSVSVLWAAAPNQAREVIWAAHREGVAAAMAFVETEAAWSRTGHDGIRQVDTTGLIHADFDHRMSRAGDAQIHTHVAVLNRVRCHDGQWRALDSRAVYRAAAAAGAIYDQVREAALERHLGVAHELRQPGQPREIVGVSDQVCALFSTRRAQITGRVSELVHAWQEAHPGQTPSAWMVAKLSQWVTLETRPSKPKTGESTTEALARWERESRAQLGITLAEVWAQATTAAPSQPPAEAAGDDTVVAEVIAALDAAKSTWTRYDLIRELTRRCPVRPGEDTSARLGHVEQLANTALTAERWGVVPLDLPPLFPVPPVLRRRSDGESVYTRHGAARYTTSAGLAAEHAVLAAARDHTAPRVPAALVEQAIDTHGLGDDQAAAARAVLASGTRLQALVGPAGTGKTTTMAAVAQGWTAAGGQVLGVSIAENAVRILADVAGIRGVNAAKLLYEHTHRPERTKAQPAWQARYGIKPGALVIIDEAGMASRQTIDGLRRLAAAAGAKVLLVGDHEQLDSPEGGGVFELAAHQPDAVRLRSVRRFERSWEAAASLRLRAGDVTVLDDYDRRGRIAGGDQDRMEDRAFTAALADRSAGRSVYLLAETNESAARMAGRYRDHLVDHGVVDDTVTAALGDGNRVGAGDLVVTRRNRRYLVADGRFVANRDVWRVTQVHSDGALTVQRAAPTAGQNSDGGEPRPGLGVRPGGDRLELQAAYAGEHVRLEYATTVHSAQGGTRDVAHAVISERSDRHGLYVAMTRGRAENWAYTVCERPTQAANEELQRIYDDPLAVLASVMARDDSPDQHAALTVHERLADDAASLATLYPIWVDLLAQAGPVQAHQALTEALDHASADKVIFAPSWPALAARLRRLDAAGVDAAAALGDAARRREIEDADDLAAVLHWRLEGAAAEAAAVSADNFAAMCPRNAGQLTDTITAVARAMDARSAALAARVETEQPAWAEALGPILAHQPQQVAHWRARAAVVAGYREAFEVRRDDPVGPAPSKESPDAHAWWARAMAALDGLQPLDMTLKSDAQVAAIIDRADRALAGGPAPVDDELRHAALSLRAAQDAHGHALAAGTPDVAAGHAIEAAELAERLAALEDASAHRERWAATATRLEQQAEAARVEQEHRQAHRPYRTLATAALTLLLDKTIRDLAATQRVTADHQTHRVDAMRRHLHWLETTTRILRDTHPAETDARQSVAAEQQVAARAAELTAALHRSRLRLPLPGGPRRSDLQQELSELVRRHPWLSHGGDRQPVWAERIAGGQAADRREVRTLQTQCRDDMRQLQSAQKTLTVFRQEVDDLADTVSAIRKELEHRDPIDAAPPATRSQPAQTSSPAPPTADVHQTHLAYQQLPMIGPDIAPPQV